MRKDKVASQQSTEDTLTTDGANLTKNLNMGMTGLKEMDVVSSLPLIRSHLLKRSNNDDDKEGQLSMQSCFWCIPIKCIFGKESTDFLQEQLGDLQMLCELINIRQNRNKCELP